MTSLAISRLTGRPVAGTSLVAAAAPQPGGGVTAAPLHMMRVISPNARDRWMNGAVRDYTPDRVEQILRGAMTGNLVAAYQLYDLMEATWPRLVKNLGQLKDAVCDMDWKLQPWAAKGGTPSPEAIRRARICEDLLWQMQPEPDADENDFEDTLRDLLDATGKGISVLEIDWHTRPYDKHTVFAPRCTRWVHPQYYGYAPTGSGNRLMLDTTQVNLGDSLTSSLPRAQLKPTEASYAPFPKNKFIIGVSKSKTGHPIGGALLRTLAFYWSASQFTWEWFLNFAQIFGMPLRLAFYDPTAGPEVIAKLQDMLANMGSEAWGAFPAGTQVDFKEAAKGAGADSPHAALLDRADKICDLLVLRQTLTTDVGDSGSRALGDVHQGVLDEVKCGRGNWSGRVLTNQLVGAICELNFGDRSECPWLMPHIEDNEDPKVKAERFQILLSAGFDMEKQWAYEQHGIPLPAPGAEVIVGRSSSMPGFPGFGEQMPGGGLPPVGEQPGQRVGAKDASEALTDKLLSESSGVQAKWLGGLRPHFHRLIALAQSDKLSDADFITTLEAAAKDMPELYGKMQPTELADALYKTMSPACVNGAVQGWMKRHQAVRQKAEGRNQKAGNGGQAT